MFVALKKWVLHLKSRTIFLPLFILKKLKKHCIMELPGALFKPKLEKIKNVDSQKFLIFEEMELYLYVWKCNFLIFQEETFQARKITITHFLSPSSKKWKKRFSYFLRRKLSLYFWETELPKKNSCILGNITFLCFRNWKLKNTSYISESNFPSSEKWKEPTRKKLFTFGKCNFLAPKKLTKTC